MITRSLTEVFLLMRNNAIRNRYLYSDQLQQDNCERMSLISLNDLERGDTTNASMCPVWIDQLDKVHNTMMKLDAKIQEVNDLHSRHLHRPTLDESSEEEAMIERVTGDISSMFSTANRLIQHIKSHAYEGEPRERRLTSNVVQSLVARLQELSTKFRRTQSTYLKQMNSREERSKMYFEDDGAAETTDLIDTHFINKQQQQQLLLELDQENVQQAVEREHEVNTIVKSIVDLNDIFKELSHMVVDQGTVLDRIDYNIEQTQSQVTEGLRQLQKAHTYQRSNRKMCCIIVLAGVTILFIILLLIFKT